MSFPPSPQPYEDVQRVLCVVAHPDDLDFSTAGTIATWVDAGLEVSYLLVTRGESGGFDEAVPRADIPGIREAEQRAAAAAVGVKTVEFLDGYVDGTVTNTLDLRRDIAAAIRRFRPDRVVASAPERRWDRVPSWHPDHRAVGDATLDAIYPDARNPFAFADTIGHLPAWTVREVWLINPPGADHHVDITAVFDRKLAALRAHESQTAHEDVEGMLRPWNAANARAGGIPEGTLAESFVILRTG